MGAAEWIDRWWRSIVLVAAGAAMVAVVGQDGYLGVGLALGAVLLGGAVAFSPLRDGLAPSHAQAQQRAATDGLLVGYWRRGAPDSERLRAELRGERGVLWVDTRHDPQAAAFVRQVNDGHEILPTVIAGTAVWPNPGVEKVRAALRATRVG